MASTGDRDLTGATDAAASPDRVVGFGRKIATLVGSSLKLKLALLIVTILGLTIGLAFWSAIRMQEHQLLEASERHLRLLHEMLQKTIVATCILTGNQESVQRVIATLRGDEDIQLVRLFDTHGVIRYSSYPSERGERLSAAELAQFESHPGPLIQTRDGEMVDTLVLPMRNRPGCFTCHPSGRKVLGNLQVSLALDPTWRQLAVLKRAALIATLLAVAVIVGGVWLSLTAFLDRPLQQMVAVMGQAERGDLGARVAIRNDDELGQLAGHFNDMISKLQGTRTQLERYHQEQLARADRLATIGELAAAIAHEIRNPLTGISGALSVLSRDFPRDDARRDVVRQTQLLIDRLNQSVENILLYSRPSLPQLQAVKLDDVVDRTLALVNGEAAKANISIVKELASQREQDTGSPVVRVDPHQMQQVLTNVLLNAVQATPAGGRICIRTGTAAGGPDEPARAYVEVEDSGSGMAPDEAARAFQPFFSTKPRGTGLGLPIARQIVEQHHGRISMRSTPGRGTCVRVELPGCGDRPS